MSKVPKEIYLERWPANANRCDTIHYEPVGYGDDLRGNTSTIHRYILAPKRKAKKGGKRG
jgi:hypothetical protein